MEDNMKKQARQIVLDMVQLLQGSPAKAGMEALDTVLGNLLMIRRTLVSALPADAQDVCRMEMLNILLVHVFSPYDTTTETLRHMANYIINHADDTTECNVELTPAAAEGSGVASPSAAEGSGVASPSNAGEPEEERE